jgi:DNA-binding transcriptional LysR family regulator
MNDRDWEILRILYDKRNITQAAKTLYISQPALTFRLQQMEKEFGIRIAYRGRKGLEFTVQGEHLVLYAKEMLLQLRKTKDILCNMESSSKGIVRLGVAGTIACYVLPAILKQFNIQYPDIEFNINTGWSADMVNLLLRQEVHIGIIRGDYNWPDQKQLLMEEPLLVVSSREIKLDDLPYLPRIDYKTDPTLKESIDNWWLETYSQAPLSTMHVDKLETCKEFVRYGLGYAIFPGLTIKDEDHLFSIKLLSKDNVPVMRRTWLLYRKKSLELSIVKTFTDFLKNYSYQQT